MSAASPLRIRPTCPALIAPALCAALCAALAQAQPQEAPPDKSSFTLFNPTPLALMRALSPDRPDATESPVTVDAGHVQLEMSYFDYTYDREDGVKFDAWAFGDINLKLGLTNNVDVQLLWTAYVEEQTRMTGAPRETVNGVGDALVRLKLNLWGNDPTEGQTTAFGVMPFVKIPTGSDVSNDHLEGGFIAMFAWDFAERASLGFQGEIDLVYNDAEGDYDLEFVHTAVLGVDLIGPVGVFIEYLGIIGTDGDPGYQAILSTGATVQITDNLMFDAGVQVGLTDDADDVRVFVGMTVRR